MKNICILINAVMIGMFVVVAQSRAEIIYFKDGRVLNADITGRSKKSIWVHSGVGSAGFKIKTIERIENKDGSISKFDYNSLGNKIEELISRQEYKKAEEACNLLLEAFPGDIKMHQLKAMLNQKVGDFDKAIQGYKFLIGKRLGDDKIFNNLGVIYININEYELAFASFASALRYNPNMVEAHNNLADLALKRQDYERAISEYNKVLERESRNAKVLYNLGLAYMNKGDYLNARIQWGKALAITPEDAEVKNALASTESKINIK